MSDRSREETGDRMGRRRRMPTDADPTFEALLGYLKQSRGFDFSGYKRLSLLRRFRI